MDTLVRHCKGEKNILYPMNSKHQQEGSPPRRSQPMQSSHVESKTSGTFNYKSKELLVASGSKTITHKQLKDTIE
jgi:hypothetical protein